MTLFDILNLTCATYANEHHKNQDPKFHLHDFDFETMTRTMQSVLVKLEVITALNFD